MDGTENQADTLQEKTGQSSAEETQGTSTDKAKTYTEEEFQNRVSDSLAKAGRDDKSLSEREAAINAREETIKQGEDRIADFERQQDAAELAEAKSDPDKMRAYQDKQTEKQRAKSLETREAELKKREREQDRKEAENAETVRAAQQHQMEMSLWEIAAKYDVNPQTLKEGVADFNLTTVEQAEKLAKRLSTGERPPEGAPEGEKKTTPIAVPTIGGRTGKLTNEQRERQSMEDYAAQRKSEQPDKFPL